MRSMTFYGNTDVGRLRANNEDAFVAQNIWDENHILAVAIDGLGGYEGGEVASALARKQIVEYLENYSDGERLELLKQAVVSVNNTIFAERKNQRQYSNMSCVLTAVLIEVAERRVNMAHVGDTRLYQFADDRLVKLSHDHSLVGYREEIGELTEEEAMRHPQRNIIGRDIGSKYLGDGDTDYVETAVFPLLPHATLLLCSDGLCDMVTSSRTAEILRQPISVEDKVNELIAAANHAGGKDNVTVVLVASDFEESVPMTAAVRIGSDGPDYSESPETADAGQAEMRYLEEETSGTDGRGGPKRLKGVPGLVLAWVVGFLMGGFLGHKLFPRIFPDIVREDKSAVCPDSLDSVTGEVPGTRRLPDPSNPLHPHRLPVLI